MNIIFFGTSSFSAGILEEIFLGKTHTITAVVTQPDKPVGRKQELTPSPVAIKATELGITTLKPTTLKAVEFEAELRNFNCDFFVVVAYGKIIPANILNIPLKAPLNIHGSLLPKYRGSSPIQNAIFNGETETGITTMIMDEQMDHGPMLLKDTITIAPDDTFVEVEGKLLEVAKTLISKTISQFEEITPEDQDHSQATFTKIITKEDGKIDWSKTAQEIYNQYRAYIIWPGVWTTWNGKILKIKKCRWNSATNTEALVYQDQDKIFIGTPNGSLELLEVQLEGKNTTAISDYVKGYQDFIGSKLI